jgi:predicted permease
LGGDDFRNVFIGALIFGIIFGLAAVFMPTIHKLWLTAIIIMVGEMVILLGMIRFQKK